MSDEKVLWTAVPHGISPDGGTARLSVVVGPRLTADFDDQPLSAFPAFAVWPNALAGMTFSLEFSGGGTVDVTRDKSVPDAKLWTDLFSDDCPVRTRKVMDLTNIPLRSFPCDEVTKGVTGVYATVAQTSGTSFPIRDTVKHLIGDDIVDRWREPDSRYTPLNREVFQGTPPIINRNDPKYDSQRKELAFAQAYRFYERPHTRDADPRRASVRGVTAPPKVPRLNFHGICAFLADYPDLLRRLGLVVDLQFPAKVLTGNGQVRVLVKHPKFGWMASEGLRPWTRFISAPGRFEAEPRPGGDFRSGMVDLGAADRWYITDLDIDGSAMKYVDFAQTISRLENPKYRSSDDPNTISLPALRSGGVTVSRVNRAASLAAQILQGMINHQATATNTPPVLFADDLVRGYRIDVGTVGAGGAIAEWRSLCRRVGEYVITRGGTEIPVAVEPDEGYVKSGTATSVPEGDPDLYLHEAVFGWDGWSLVAPRPGKAIGVDDATTVPDPAVAPEAPLKATFKPQPGTLPQLRYGRTYRLRARAVDLAGNSAGVKDDIDPKLFSPPVTYHRWDPVLPPVVVPRRPFKEGESLQRMVIRSTQNVKVSDYVALPRVTGLPNHGTTSGAGGLDLSYRDHDERHLAPPKTSQQAAELHGKWDAAMGEHPNYEQWFLQARREAGTFLDVQVIDAADPNVVHDISAIVHVVSHNPLQPPTKTLPLAQRGDPLGTGEYVVHDTDDLMLPYLPDPAARGWAVRGLPGMSGQTIGEPFEGEGDWPDVKPIRLRIVGGTSPSSFYQDRVLTVFLPQATVARVQISCNLRPADLALFGIWSLLSDAQKTQMAPSAAKGEHWMLTPWTVVELVHAVEKPLTPAVFGQQVKAVRLAGETFAALEDTMTAHAASTSRVDIDATWSEPVDDVAQPKPTVFTDLTAHVGDFRLHPTENQPAIGRDDQPGDPFLKMHRVRQEFGDTKHRKVGYKTTATTRFQEYFPPQITDDPALITNVGQPWELHVPSSRRPDPPEVLYLVPTFRWSEQRSASVVTRTRLGGGLRAYLRRPWYSSGDDELLGVVLPDQTPPALGSALRADVTAELAAAGIDEDLLSRAVAAVGLEGVAPGQLLEGLAAAVTEASTEGDHPLGARLAATPAEGVAAPSGPSVLGGSSPSKYVTQWGVDPIWSVTSLNGPRIESFPNLTKWGVGLSLVETNQEKVAVAGFTPHFDEGRGLWYCDIDIAFSEPATLLPYFPFVRLALARYQPYSILGHELSKVAVSDFIQVLPDRTTTVFSTAPQQVRVTVDGASPYDRAGTRVGTGSAAIKASREVTARVERVPRTATGGLDWQPVGSTVRLNWELIGAREAWTTFLALPPVTADSDYRIVVEEWELHESDTQEADLMMPGPGFQVPMRRRPIYMDHFPLQIKNNILVP